MHRFSQHHRISWYAALALASISLAACKVGPNYVRPQLTAPPAFRGADDAQVSSDPKNSLGDEQWSAVYQEPELQQLIRKALTNNFDLRIAAQHILEQQAQVRIVRSQQFPTVSVGGTGIGATLPSSLGNQISSPFVDGAFNLSAAWTPDFWGFYRRQTEAARAQLLAQTWAQRAVRLTLVQQIATLYLEIRALDRQLEITKQTIKVRQDSAGPDEGPGKRRVGSAGRRSPGGTTSLYRHLTGAADRTADPAVGKFDQPLARRESRAHCAHRFARADRAAQDLPTGLPSQLLERRPDIQEAEATLIAANAQIGVARAQFFPSLTISASAGVGGDSLAGIFATSGKTIYGIGSVTQPLFTGGRLRGQLELSEQAKQEMVLNYQKAISQAFRDVSNALIALKKQRTNREEQEKLVAAAEDSVRLARLRYQGGSTGYLEVLTTDSNLFAAQLNLVIAQQDEALTLVQLYGALGGGWQG